MAQRIKQAAGTPPADSPLPGSPAVPVGAQPGQSVPGAQPGTDSAGQPQQPPAEPVPQANEHSALLEFVRDQHGLDFTGKYRDDLQLIGGLVNAAQLVGRRDADAEYGRAVRQHEGEFAQFMAWKNGQGQPQGQPGQQPQAQEPQGDPRWQAPQWNPGWSQWIQEVTDPATGATRNELRQDTPMQIRQSIDQFRAWKQEFDQNWATNPAEMVDARVNQLVEQRVSAMLEQRFSQERGVQTAQQIVQRNAEWIHARDPQGQPLVDPMTGQRVMTPRGQAYMKHIQHTMRLTPDPVAADHLAQQLANGEVAMLLVQQLLAGQPQPSNNGRQAALPAPQPAVTLASPPIPAGAGHRGNSTAGAALGATVQPKFPPTMRLSEKIRRLGQMSRAANV